MHLLAATIVAKDSVDWPKACLNDVRMPKLEKEGCAKVEQTHNHNEIFSRSTNQFTIIWLFKNRKSNKHVIDNKQNRARSSSFG